MFTTTKPYVAYGVTKLTRREKEILKLASFGMSNLQIARQLFIESTTVKFHLSSIYRKLGAHNRTQAVHLAKVRHIIA